jgi:hypothetical protein
MLWRSVQLDLPSNSTSGGQSAGGCAILEDPATVFFVLAAHEAKEVQFRHLCFDYYGSGWRDFIYERFTIWTEDYTLGNRFLWLILLIGGVDGLDTI